MVWCVEQKICSCSFSCICHVPSLHFCMTVSGCSSSEWRCLLSPSNTNFGHSMFPLHLPNPTLPCCLCSQVYLLCKDLNIEEPESLGWPFSCSFWFPKSRIERRIIMQLGPLYFPLLSRSDKGMLKRKYLVGSCQYDNDFSDMMDKPRWTQIRAPEV